MYRIGGRAHIRGITFTSDIATVRASENSKDTVRLFSERTLWLKARLKKIPLLRVFPAFGTAGAVLFVMVIALLLADVFVPSLFEYTIPDTLLYPLSGGVSAAAAIIIVLAGKRIRRLLQYHGAEHMAINTYRQGKALTEENIADADRATPSCGSSFVLIFLIVAVPLMFVPYSDYVLPVVLGIAFELTLLARRIKWLRWLLRFGMWLQRRIFTRQPDAAQIRIARRGLCTLIDITHKQGQAVVNRQLD